MKYIIVFSLIFLLNCSNRVVDTLNMTTCYYEKVGGKNFIKLNDKILLNYLPNQVKIKSKNQIFFVGINSVIYFNKYKKKVYNCNDINRILDNKDSDSTLIIQKYNNDIFKINLKTGNIKSVYRNDNNDIFLSLNIKNYDSNEVYDDSEIDSSYFDLFLHSKDTLHLINTFFTTEKKKLDTLKSFHFFNDFSFYDKESNSFIYWYLVRDKNGSEIQLYEINEHVKETKLIFKTTDLFFNHSYTFKFKKFKNNYYLSYEKSIFLIENNKLNLIYNFKNSNLDWHPSSL